MTFDGIASKFLLFADCWGGVGVGVEGDGGGRHHGSTTARLEQTDCGSPGETCSTPQSQVLRLSKS